MPLPVLTTADDVREIVRYLKNKATGADLSEAKAAVRRQVLDGRKLSAYQYWDIVIKDGDRLRLSQRGRELARTPESGASVFKSVLDSVKPYRSVLEWIHHQNLPSVSNVEVAAHWHEHHSDALGTDNENTIKDTAVCFFHICQAAELGTSIIGRRGQATRLDMNRENLRAYIEAGPSAPPWTEEPSSATQVEATFVEEAKKKPIERAEPLQPVATPAQGQPRKSSVFISHGKNMDIVGQVQTMLEFAGMDPVVAEKEETAAIPVPDKVFTAMRKCQSGIIVVTAEEGLKDSSGNYSLNENVLIEIGAAFVLYDRRVVLLWDKRLPVPSNLQGLYRCEFQGSELSWSDGMKLMKAIQGFRQ